MKLGELLKDGLVLTGLQAKDKTEAIGKLVDALVAHGGVAAGLRKTMADALLMREKIASTGMEHGVAIPHASVDGIEDAVAALGLSADGIPFQSADGQPARLIVLLIIPRRAVQKHIRTLAGIARLMNYEEMRDALLRARSPQEALKIIRDEEQKEGGSADR